MTYINIPVDKDTGMKVKQIAAKNGLTLGKQVKVWADEAMPKCGHALQPVTIQTFPQVERGQIDIRYKTAWYCPKCRRVYAEA